MSINRGWQGRQGNYTFNQTQFIQNALKPETVKGCISQRQPFCVRGRGGTGIPGEVLLWKCGRALCDREFACGRHWSVFLGQEFSTINRAEVSLFLSD